MCKMLCRPCVIVSILLLLFMKSLINKNLGTKAPCIRMNNLKQSSVCNLQKEREKV